MDQSCEFSEEEYFWQDHVPVLERLTSRWRRRNGVSSNWTALGRFFGSFWNILIWRERDTLVWLSLLESLVDRFPLFKQICSQIKSSTGQYALSQGSLYALFEQIVQFLWIFLWQFWRLAFDHLVNHIHQTFAVERMLIRAHLIQQAPHRPTIQIRKNYSSPTDWITPLTKCLTWLRSHRVSSLPETCSTWREIIKLVLDGPSLGLTVCRWRSSPRPLFPPRFD